MLWVIIKEKFLKIYKQYQRGKDQAHISTDSVIAHIFFSNFSSPETRILFTLPCVFKLVWFSMLRDSIEMLKTMQREIQTNGGRTCRDQGSDWVLLLDGTTNWWDSVSYKKSKMRRGGGGRHLKGKKKKKKE